MMHSRKKQNAANRVVVCFEGEEYNVLEPAISTHISTTVSAGKSRYADTGKLLLFSALTYLLHYYHLLTYFGSLYSLFWKVLTLSAILFQIWYTRLLFKYCAEPITPSTVRRRFALQ